MHTVLKTAAVALVVLLAGASTAEAQTVEVIASVQDRTFKAEQTDRETKTFQLGASGRLSLENIVGDVTVTAGPGRDVIVDIVRVSRGRTDADARIGLDRVRVETDAGNGRASVRTQYPNERNAPYSVRAQYTVTAPTGTEVSVRSVAGDVMITGIHGDLSAVTITGNVSITNARRVSEARTTSGNVKLTTVDSDGTISASSTSGSVTALQVKARRVDFGSISDDIIARDIACDSAEFHTISGEVEFSGALAPRGRYQFTTHSGNVRITTDGKVGFAFDGSSFSGNIKSDLPIETHSAPGRLLQRSLNGTYGDGSASITATSFSGNVTIVKK